MVFHLSTITMMHGPINIRLDKQTIRLQQIILTQTLNLTFLYVTVSTLNPTVGIVVTD